MKTHKQIISPILVLSVLLQFNIPAIALTEQELASAVQQGQGLTRQDLAQFDQQLAIYQDQLVRVKSEFKKSKGSYLMEKTAILGAAAVSVGTLGILASKPNDSIRNKSAQIFAAGMVVTLFNSILTVHKAYKEDSSANISTALDASEQIKSSIDEVLKNNSIDEKTKVKIIELRTAAQNLNDVIRTNSSNEKQKSIDVSLAILQISGLTFAIVSQSTYGSVKIFGDYVAWDFIGTMSFVAASFAKAVSGAGLYVNNDKDYDNVILNLDQAAQSVNSARIKLGVILENTK